MEASAPRPLVTGHLTEVVEVVVAVVVLPPLTERPLATMEHHRVPTERPLATTARHLAATAPHRPVAAAVVSVAAESRRATVPRPAEAAVVEDHCPRLTAHLAPAAVDCPPATVLPPEAVADTRDHLRLTVHLAPVVAVSMEGKGLTLFLYYLHLIIIIAIQHCNDHDVLVTERSPNGEYGSRPRMDP